ncbi:hypothetical protein INT45_012300 [Circinella minor]|uniref:Plasma membrane proteolipid 3 n=1 Tax=Circinella minor TaxID=1195481 RepID=A0A8H7S5E8_9FUNG|nr:hypothetical protein INT45_012300 [Circinella minor]
MANDKTTDDDKAINDCLLIFITILLPPLGVGLMRGCNSDFWINFCLTLFFGLPGLIHAIYILIKEREKKLQEDRGIEEPPLNPDGYNTAPEKS